MGIKRNTIINGDAYKLIKEIPGKSIDLIVTDPPYKIEGIHASGVIKSNYENRHAKEIKDNDLDKDIDLSILDEFVRVLKKVNIYIWCNKEQILNYTDYFVKKLGCNWEILIWAKENPAPFCGTHYLKDKEYCLYFWETGADVNIPYNRAKTIYLSKVNKEDKELYLHPTIKPKEMIKTLIQNSVKINGGLILDTFAGSGTTLVACKELGLDYIGFELNERYYQIAVDRLNGIDQKGQIDLFASSENYEQEGLFNYEN